MSRRLPPLTSLRAFEAAGRHLSFTRAAAELTVTQAAISHQIKALEEHLGLPLFVRLPRKLELTRTGKVLLPVVRESFDRIAEAVTDLGIDSAGAALTVRLAPSFAAKWLSPRLEDFRRQHPDIDLSLTHSNAAVDFAREEIDLAVTYGKGDWPGVVAEPVLALDFFPVCCPAYMDGDQPLTSPHDLCHYTLLHDADYENWSDWLSLAGLCDIDPKRGTFMDDTNVLTQAAIDGLGVALGSSSFVKDHLDAGRLVKPFDLVLKSDFAYHVVCPKEHLERPEVHAFREWLLTQSDFDQVATDAPMPDR